ncbi:Rab-GTPase-TBC domain [Fusarium oxysporum f. sp. vasinfectum]|nr:Rab-GTPase-TBC domain [Fusarium oxysporum f. sp. vasinfectum]
MPQPSTTTQRDEDPFVDENSIFEPLTSIPTDPFCVVYNARCTTPPPPPQVSHSDTPLPLPAPATPTRPSRTTASTVPFSIPYSECLAGKVPSSPTYPPLSGSRSHKSPCSSLPSSPRTSCSSSPPTISKGISRSGSSRFGTFSQMFNTPIQPLWRGTASTANSSASSTPTVSAQSTITTALGATANATVNAPATDADTAIDLAESGSLPSDKEQGSSRFWNRSRSASTTSNNSTSTATLAGTTTISSNNDLPFVPLDVSIPCESLLDDAFMNTVSFSNRGSIMLGAQDAAAIDGAIKQHTMSIDSSSSTSTSTNADTDESNDMNNSVKGAGDGSPQGLMSTPDIRVLAADVEKESQKVRSLYTVGDGSHGEPGKRHSYCERLEPTPEVPSEENELDPVPNHLSPAWQMPASGSSSSLRSRGGGLEDWDDLEGAHVDRYGFITLPPPPGSRMGTPTETRSASGSPRKRSLLQKRDPYSLTSTLSGSGRRTPTRKVSARSLNTQTSELSVSTSLRSSRSVIRQASNLLPHNRDRRWMDEAGDMLNAAPSLQDIVDEIQAEKLTEVMKRKEWERSEKWRKMAKVVRRGGEGHGKEYPTDGGGAAWWSFMATSAREHEGSPSEERIVAEFHRLQRRSSPDDVQIDLDVPRTISRHIMFRRRYRGGQRLLFRVLHAISIYYPETGYVQGMASLAATLLCYFDEEKCFVMLVRMWHLRGLARLYRPGFEELMAAMGDFSKHWLNKEVASKLDELCIDTTAYGTRWYLTLFNLSVPFPAQLRIWDVFLLLGNDQPSMSESRKSESNTPQTGEYDVLHATSAALAQALREVLLDAEFENAMKALTSSIPVKDEDLLMKVVKAEYKQHHGKKKT